uniref:Major facilitator superfamily (MFS) profile domain-containing protein n=1 Tax=Trichogramma kaykai TaxID=54128 RepID=A0ABD2XNL4_9HYME
MIPCGYLASAWSPRKALFWGLGLGGLLHLLTPLVADWADWIGVCCCRLVVGMLQSCLLACTHTLMSQWSPIVERSLLSGIVNCGMAVGSIVATALSGYIATTHLGWQGIFYAFGAMSCCTSLAIFLCVHDSPAEHPRISADERDFIEAGKTTIKPELVPKPPQAAEKDAIAKQEDVKIDKLKLPWRKILTSVPMWALVIGHAGFAWGNSIFTLQVPLYMKSVLGFDIAEVRTLYTQFSLPIFFYYHTRAQIGLASSLPFISSLLTLFPASWLADYTIKRGYLGVAGVRRIWNSLGTCVPALALVVISQIDGYDPIWPVALLALAKGFESCTASGYFVNHIDLSPNYAGTMISMSNCVASVVTMLVPIVTGAIIGDSNKNNVSIEFWKPKKLRISITRFSFERELGKNFIKLSPSAVENSSVYYGVCADGDTVRRLDCVLYRVTGDFYGGSPKEDKCPFTIKSELRFGGQLILQFIKIDSLGRDRAIVRWAEEVGDPKRAEHRFRLAIVDFSNCKVTLTNPSLDLDRLIEGKKIKSKIRRSTLWGGFRNTFYVSDDPVKFDHNWPLCQKGEDDFEIVSIVYDEKSFSNNSISTHFEVLRASIDADGVVAKVDTLLPRTLSTPVVLVHPLSKDHGYLYIASESTVYKQRSTMTVALIQPNGQRRNLTQVQNVYHVGYASISLANGMIGICVPQNYTMTLCTQFRLDDQEIKWFPVSLYMENLYSVGEVKRLIYNLPQGEGFLTEIADTGIYPNYVDKYLLKIGLDGKVKQFLDPDMCCKLYKTAVAVNNIFEDDRGNYCVTLACWRYVESERYFFELDDGRNNHYVKLQSKCFEPEDFKNVSKYEVIAEYKNGYPLYEGHSVYDGLVKLELLIE